MLLNESPQDKLVKLIQQVDQFSNERDWGKFHTLKNLSMALTVESAELMEIFQWPESANGIGKTRNSLDDVQQHV